jgi:ubiquinone/menaquinone biosynthesis C-methylase UbiE
MELAYFTDEEYQRAFFEFGKFRAKVAKRIHEIARIDDGIVLDLLSGHGFLSMEFAKVFPDALFLCTGLRNDADSYRNVNLSNRYPTHIISQIQYIMCDVTRIPLRAASCEMIVNFLGLEDVNMLYGKSGVMSLFEEASRLLKPNGLLQISFVEYGNNPAEQIAKEIWNVIGLNAVFYDRDEYVEMLKPYRFEVTEEFVLKDNKKMTSDQAKEEIQFACNEAPKIYSGFGVEAIPFDEIWERFRMRIMKFGMGYWSPIRVMIFSR